MKTIITISSIMLAAVLLSPQSARAQGTTYLSNLDQTSSGSRAVGSDSWLAIDFVTGNNAGGYGLNSVQLAMTDASGNPSGFAVMIYGDGGSHPGGPSPGSSLGTLNGSLNPVTSGIYTYMPDSNLTLLPGTDYFIVLTSGTVVANGVYGWSFAAANAYHPSGGWAVIGGLSTHFLRSSDGSSWTSISSAFPQFAINATAVPEPSTFSLLGLGGLLLLRHHRKSKGQPQIGIRAGRRVQVTDSSWFALRCYQHGPRLIICPVDQLSEQRDESSRCASQSDQSVFSAD